MLRWTTRPVAVVPVSASASSGAPTTMRTMVLVGETKDGILQVPVDVVSHLAPFV